MTDDDVIFGVSEKKWSETLERLEKLEKKLGDINDASYNQRNMIREDLTKLKDQVIFLDKKRQIPLEELREMIVNIQDDILDLKEQIDYINKKHNIDQNWNIEQKHKLQEVFRELIEWSELEEGFRQALLAKLDSGKEEYTGMITGEQQIAREIDEGEKSVNAMGQGQKTIDGHNGVNYSDDSTPFQEPNDAPGYYTSTDSTPSDRGRWAGKEWYNEKLREYQIQNEPTPEPLGDREYYEMLKKEFAEHGYSIVETEDLKSLFRKLDVFIHYGENKEYEEIKKKYLSEEK